MGREEEGRTGKTWVENMKDGKHRTGLSMDNLIDSTQDRITSLTQLRTGPDGRVKCLFMHHKDCFCQGFDHADDDDDDDTLT